MAQQEAHWKEAYDVLVAENNALKSSGSEALLASQWRQRYETLLKEKEDLESKLKMERQKTEMADAGKYESKYRDLKESFRLYRKKAKEIFEAQQNGEHGVSRIDLFSYAPQFFMATFDTNPHIFSAFANIGEIERRRETLLFEESYGKLPYIGYRRARTYGRCHMHSIAVYS